MSNRNKVPHWVVEIMRLFVSGGKHIHWDSEGRREEITEALNGMPDVVFSEERTEPPRESELRRNLLAAPLIVITISLYSLALRLLRVPFSSDSKLTSNLSDKDNVDVIGVDRALTPMISEGRKLWTLSNWSTILIVLLLFQSVGFSNAALVLIIFSVIIVMDFIAGTAAPRNYAMALNLMKAVKKNEYNRGVLVVGGEHKDEVKEHIQAASNEIEVVESESTQSSNSSV